MNLPFETLESIGARLGADVPFLVRGGTAFAEGIGERLTFVEPLELPEGAALLIATPLDSVPTKDAYAGVPKSGPDRWERYKAAWKDKMRSPSCGDPIVEPPSDTESFEQMVNPDLCFNAFEISVFPTHPLVAEMKQKFIELGPKSL